VVWLVATHNRDPGLSGSVKRSRRHEAWIMACLGPFWCGLYGAQPREPNLQLPKVQPLGPPTAVVTALGKGFMSPASSAKSEGEWEGWQFGRSVEQSSPGLIRTVQAGYTEPRPMSDKNMLSQ